MWADMADDVATWITSFQGVAVLAFGVLVLVMLLPTPRVQLLPLLRITFLSITCFFPGYLAYEADAGNSC